MSEGATRQRRLVAGDSVPRLAAQASLRFDEARRKWIVLAPERLFMPDDQALEILRMADGKQAVGAIVDALAVRYNAPREVIATDVTAMFQDLADKGVIDV